MGIGLKLVILRGLVVQEYYVIMEKLVQMDNV
jgi:hypothetical protein